LRGRRWFDLIPIAKDHSCNPKKTNPNLNMPNKEEENRKPVLIYFQEFLNSPKRVLLLVS
jgi:hypothetical protein